MSGEHANERADHFGQRDIPGLIRHYLESDCTEWTPRPLKIRMAL